MAARHRRQRPLRRIRRRRKHRGDLIPPARRRLHPLFRRRRAALEGLAREACRCRHRPPRSRPARRDAREASGPVGWCCRHRPPRSRPARRGAREASGPVGWRCRHRQSCLCRRRGERSLRRHWVSRVLHPPPRHTQCLRRPPQDRSRSILRRRPSRWTSTPPEAGPFPDDAMRRRRRASGAGMDVIQQKRRDKPGVSFVPSRRFSLSAAQAVCRRRRA